MFRKIRDGAKLWILIVSSGVMLLAQAACERALTLEEESAAQRTETCLDLVADSLMQDSSVHNLNLPSKFMKLQFDALEETIGSAIVRTGNEAHDCQRLFDRGGDEGPLAGVYALKGLANADYNNFTLVAAVLSEGKYADLGIDAGKNCLFVKGKDSSLDGFDWEARMVSAPQTPCDAVIPTPSNSTLLPAFRVVDPNGSNWPDRAPNAARWVDENGRYYIAFQCQKYFCFVGTEVRGQPPKNYTGHKHARGDQQFLAVKDNTGKWRRSKLRATLVPEPNLGHLGAGNFTTLQKVATLTLSGSDPYAQAKYIAKFGADQGNIDVKLKHDGGDWWVQYSTNTYTSPLYKVVYHHGSMKSGRGTVRFLWSQTDEKLWIQCAGGCCGASN